MTIPQAPASTFNVPTIDISPYLLDPSSPEALTVVNAVRTACVTTGFFQLIGHGISRSLQDTVFKGSEALFKLPMEEKVKMDRSHSIGASNRGYELIGGQGLQEDTLPDLKEVSASCPGHKPWCKSEAKEAKHTSIGILRRSRNPRNRSPSAKERLPHGSQSLAQPIPHP